MLERTGERDAPVIPDDLEGGPGHGRDPRRDLRGPVPPDAARALAFSLAGDRGLRRAGCGRCFLVLDPETFTAQLVARLEAAGLCAYYDGEELGVKGTNDFNDQFDVLTFEMYLRRENGAYRSTCRPAWF